MENQLLRYCRYYKGEKEMPKFDNQDKELFWSYEKVWVESKSGENNHDMLAKMIGEYVAAGLGGFEIYDDTPMTLKAMLFNRYLKGGLSMSEAAEPFKKFYRDYYIAEAERQVV